MFNNIDPMAKLEEVITANNINSHNVQILTQTQQNQMHMVHLLSEQVGNLSKVILQQEYRIKSLEQLLGK
jgi:hypothetical protein